MNGGDVPEKNVSDFLMITGQLTPILGKTEQR